jgi:hypothetical protein
MNIEDVDRVLDEINEQTDQMRQIQDAMGQPIGPAADIDDDELEMDLEVCVCVCVWGGGAGGVAHAARRWAATCVLSMARGQRAAAGCAEVAVKGEEGRLKGRGPGEGLCFELHAEATADGPGPTTSAGAGGNHAG